MVWHNHSGMHHQALAIELEQTGFDGIPHVGTGQRTGAHAGVEPLFEFLAEAFIVFVPSVVVPRLGVHRLPCVALGFPGIEFGLRQRICHPKSDPVDGTISFPVREVASRLCDF